MRVILFSYFVFCSMMLSTAQVNGGFKSEADNYGNEIVYFEGQNVANSTLYDMKIYCVNEIKDQKKELVLSGLIAGQKFTVGLREGWSWENGEKLYVVYSNGRSVYWTFSQAGAIQYNNTNDATQRRLKIQQIDLQINQYQRKLQDAQRSLQLSIELGNKNPSITNSMLQQSQRNLIQTYEQQIANLQNQRSSLSY